MSSTLREERLLLASLSKTEENLAQFEKQYQMSSKVFFDQYQSGKTDDRNDFIDWAGEYQIFLSISEKIMHIRGVKIESNYTAH